MAVANEENVDPKEGGIDLGFRNLIYTVDIKTKAKKTDAPTTKTIISDCSGVCRAGRLLAIMGPSGAGKTSLLDILAGRKSQSGGELSLGQGSPASPMQIQRYASYVQQDDAIMPTQTAREALVMAALLTLPRTMPTQEKLSRVDAIMKTFHLEGCANTPVGDPIGKVKGLSGGERKRCAVAMSAIREPKILFLDEPTSGLDSFKAFTLVEVLKEMAQGKQSNVICTIHQPSSDIFAVFDDLMLIFNGHVVFHGHATQAVIHFSNAGYACPQYANPADFFFMHILTFEPTSRADELVKAWQACPEITTMEEAVKDLFSRELPAGEKSSYSVMKSGGVEKSSMGTQLNLLLRRGINDVKRNPMRAKAFMGQSIIMGIIVSLIWWQVADDQNGVQDRSGVLFFLTTNTMMTNVMGVLTTFGGERGAVLREQENGMYTTLPYFVSRILCDLPVKILGTSLFGTIAYWCVGFQPDVEKFFMTIGFLNLLALAGNSMGLFLACIFPDMAVALAIAPLIILPLVMFSGFVLNPESIPVYLAWLEWLSPTKYSFAAMAQIEFGGLSIRCTGKQLQTKFGEDGAAVEFCAIPSGDDFLDKLNIQEILTLRNCALLLVVLLVAFKVLAFVGLVVISRKNRAKAVASSKKA